MADLKNDDQVHSTHSTLRLVSASPQSYAGYVAEDSEFVIFFPENPDVQGRIINISGDQGKAKTSFMNMIKELMGGDSPKNAVNTETKKKLAGLIFEDTLSGNQYECSVTNKTFTLKLIQKRGDEVSKLTVSSPKEELRKIIGPLGIDPLQLKLMKPAEQIAWVRGLFKLTGEQLEMEKQINDGIYNATSRRKKLNSDMKVVRGNIIMYGFGTYASKDKTLTPSKKYKEEKAKYSQDIEERKKEVKQRFDDSVCKRDRYKHFKTQHESVTKSNTDIDAEIARLEQKILSLKDSQKANYILLETINKGIEETQSAEEEFTAASAEMEEVNVYITGKNALDMVAADFAKYDNLEEEWKLEDGKIVEYLQKRKEFIKIITPDIEGVEIYVPGDLDKDKAEEEYREQNEGATDKQVKDYLDTLTEREGLYYKGHSMTECSESEIFELGMGFWKQMGVQMAFIEDVTRLGSNAIETLNQLAASGCYIFITTMKRKENLKIEFIKTIE